MKPYGQIILSDAQMIQRARRDKVTITANFLAADNYRDSPDAPKSPGCAQGFIRQIQIVATPKTVALWAGPKTHTPACHAVIPQSGGSVPGMAKVAESQNTADVDFCDLLSQWARDCWDLADISDKEIVLYYPSGATAPV